MSDSQINMEEETVTFSEEILVAGNDLIKTIEKLMADTTVHRMIVKSPSGDELFQVPAVVGVAAAVALPALAIVAAGLKFFMNYQIVVVRRHTVVDSTAVDVTEIKIVDEPEVEKPKAKAKPAPKAEPKPAAKPAPKAKAKSKPKAKAKATAKPDDLTQVKGIGPVYMKVLNKAGINSYADLAKSDVPTLTQILNDAGHKRLSQPDSWPTQAAELAKG